MKNNLTPKETAYMGYLSTSRTTAEICAHFGARENTCWQILRTLRLKNLVHRVNGNPPHWKITEDGDDVPPIPVTQLQTKYLEYLRTPHTTTEMVTHFGKTECAVQQVTRTLRLMGYVESVGTGSRKGGGGCWNIWKSTNEGTKTLADEK